jgi:hypothetical protein
MKGISSAQVAMQNILMFNGLSVQDVLCEATAELALAEICFAEYFQIFMDYVGVHI